MARLFPVFLFILICFVIFCGCTQTQSKTIEKVPTRIDSLAVPNTYQKYVNTEDHFSIYLPPDWSTKVVDKSENEILSDLDKTDDVLPKAVFFNDKNSDSSKYLLLIYGMNLNPVTCTGDYTDSTTCLKGINDGFIEAAVKSLKEGGAIDVKVKSSGVQNYYGMNDASTNVLTYTSNGVKFTSNQILIKTASRVYFILYFATDDVYAKQIETINIIIPTFRSTD